MRQIELRRNDRHAYAAELERFFARHRDDLTSKRGEFAATVADGAAHWARLDAARLEALPETSNVPDAVLSADAGSRGIVYGMCGLLRQVDNLATEA
jgi:hypothetical protein